MTAPKSPTGEVRQSTGRGAVLARLLGAVVLGWATMLLLRQGDVLALPAVALVLATWSTLATLALLARTRSAVQRAWPRVRSLAGEAWAAIGDEPEFQRFGRVGAIWDDRVRPAAADLHRRWPLDGGRTFALLVALASGAAITWLWTLIRLDPPTFDRRFVDLATELAIPAVRKTMLAITVVGNTSTVVGLLALASGLLWWTRDRRGAVLLLAPPVGATILTNILKLAVQRQRPALGQLSEATHSWPSGHSTIGLGLALGVLLLAAHRGWRWRRVALGIAPLGILIGYSRAYLTVHWLTDVATGWMVAVLATGATVLAMGTPSADAKPRPDRRLARSPGLALGLATVLAVGAIGLASARRGLAEPPTPPFATVDFTDPLLPDLLGDPFTRTLLGQPMEPVSLVVVADTETFLAAVGDAGWNLADRPTIDRLIRTYSAGARGDADPAAPVTPTFLHLEVQDLAIQRSTRADGVRARHHARFWNQRTVLADGCQVWFGTASLDDRIEWTWRTLIPEHHIAPAVDVERDVVAEALTQSGALVLESRPRIVEPTLGTNAADDPFFTDGTAVVLRQASPCTPPDVPAEAN